jgi:hypothetical protein
MLPQLSLRYSRTGIVLNALGSFELENVCLALAGSLKMNIEVKTEKKNREWLTYLENLVHELELIPVPFTNIKVGIIFSFQVRNFITLICQLGKMVEGLYEWIISRKLERLGVIYMYLPQQ